VVQKKQNLTNTLLLLHGGPKTLPTHFTVDIYNTHTTILRPSLSKSIKQLKLFA